MGGVHLGTVVCAEGVAHMACRAHRGGEEVSKKMDPDVKVLRACVRELEKSSSPRMLRANLRFLWDRYISSPVRRTLPAAPTQEEKPE